MKPVDFAGSNIIYAKDQGEYLPLPANKDSDGIVTSCWGMSWRERMRVALIGRVWVQTMTFNAPLQPIKVSVNRPDDL